jgi:hypothetical protein
MGRGKYMKAGEVPAPDEKVWEGEPPLLFVFAKRNLIYTLNN